MKSGEKWLFLEAPDFVFLYTYIEISRKKISLNQYIRSFSGAHTRIKTTTLPLKNNPMKASFKPSGPNEKKLISSHVFASPILTQLSRAAALIAVHLRSPFSGRVKNNAVCTNT